MSQLFMGLSLWAIAQILCDGWAARHRHFHVPARRLGRLFGLALLFAIISVKLA